MDDQNTGNEVIETGDRVFLMDKDMSGEVIQVREFDGKKTYVVNTEKGNRIVVGQKQVNKLAA